VEVGGAGSRVAVAALVAMALLLAASPAALAITEDDKVVASDATEADAFGDAVAVDRNRLLVGAPLEDVGVIDDQGAVYLFRRKGSTWVEAVKLTASDGFIGDLFGSSVAMDGETLVVGAGGEGLGRGAVYVFRRKGSTWTEEAKLTASDGDRRDGLGKVAVDGNTVLAGAAGDDFRQGAAYVFRRRGSTWTEEAKLTASDGSFEDLFGTSVALDRGTALVGAPGDEDSEGSAYVFTRSGSTWTQRRKLTALHGAPDDSFGGSVDLDGETALIGTPSDNVRTRANQGSAYVFTGRRSTWTQRRKLIASDGAAFDAFGGSVALDGRTALLGAPLDNVQGDADRGSAYVFRRTQSTWSQGPKLIASDGAAGDHLGSSLDLDADTAAVGTPFPDDFRGAVYIFDL
jgi:hypothetical protein